MSNVKDEIKYYANKVRINRSTLRGIVTCIACNKVRGVYGSKKSTTKEHLDWSINHHAKDYERQCGETMFPDDDRN